MSEPEYICLSCGNTIYESEVNLCEECGHRTCPRITAKLEVCGGQVVTIKEYDEAMRVNSE